MTRKSVVQRLARRIAPPPACAQSTFRNCVVHHTLASGSADGTTAVFIQRGSDVIPAPYLESYNAAAAAAGDMVRVEFADGSPLIHGQVIGLPNLS